MTLYLADENVDLPIIARLRELGYNVQSVAEGWPSLNDTQVLQWALERQAVLLTEDKDFGELVFRQRRMNSGSLRLAGLPPADSGANRCGFLESFLAIPWPLHRDFLREYPGSPESLRNLI